MAVHILYLPGNFSRVLTGLVLTLLSIVGAIRVELALLPCIIARLNEQESKSVISVLCIIIKGSLALVCAERPGPRKKH